MPSLRTQVTKLIRASTEEVTTAATTAADGRPSSAGSAWEKEANRANEAFPSWDEKKATRQPTWLWGDAVFLRGICRDLGEVHFERCHDAHRRAHLRGEWRGEAPQVH